jgi:hypothetical protein
LLPFAQLRSPSRNLTVMEMCGKSTCVFLNGPVFQSGFVCVYGPEDLSFSI